MGYFISWLVSAFVGGAVGYLIGKPKGRKDEGLILGALFGPLGWIIAACLSEKQRGAPLSKFARRGGEWPAGTVRNAYQPSGIKLRCPNCGEIGFVPHVEALAVTCPTCQEKFEAAQNIAVA